MNIRNFALCTFPLFAPVAVLVLAGRDLIPLGFAVPAAVAATFFAALVNMLVGRYENDHQHTTAIERIS
jgi:hypothetical protein